MAKTLTSHEDMRSITVNHLLETLSPVTDCNTPDYKVCSIFFNDLSNVLADLGRFQPQYETKVKALLNGTKMLLKILNEENPGNTVNPHGAKKCPTLSDLLDTSKEIDDQICNLMQQKMTLYEHFKSSSGAENSGKVLGTSALDNVPSRETVSKTFSPEAIQKTAELQKKLLTLKSEISDIASTSIDLESMIDNACCYPKKTASYVIPGTFATVISVHEGRRIVGTLGGVVYHLCPRSGHFTEIVSHKRAVTSICFWNDYVLSTSYDTQVIMSNIVDNPGTIVKKTTLKQPIQCMAELFGVLYLGSTYGHLLELNLRSFTQVKGKTSQINRGFLSIKSGKCLGSYVIITLCVDFIVTIRDVKGTVLFSISPHNAVPGLHVVDGDPFKCLFLTRSILYILHEENKSLVLDKVFNHEGDFILYRSEKAYIIKKTGEIMILDCANKSKNVLEWRSNFDGFVLSAEINKNELILGLDDFTVTILTLPDD